MKVTPPHVSFGSIYCTFAFSCAFCFIVFCLFLFVMVFYEEKYKLQAWLWKFWKFNELLGPVAGGLFSCGKPQPFATFVSDEAAARQTETQLQSLTLTRRLTEAVRLLSVITAKQFLSQ